MQANTAFNINRGSAVIFNNDTFKANDHAPKEGTYVFFEDKHEDFRSVSFNVSIRSNVEYSKIKQFILRGNKMSLYE
jgi:hypothetical protein